MSAASPGTRGAARTCPHCRETILESATICPACRHHLRFDPKARAEPIPQFCPLRVEGTIVHPGDVEPWEYSVLLTILDDRGRETARRVVGVGVMHPAERRSFTLAVEVFTNKP